MIEPKGRKSVTVGATLPLEGAGYRPLMYV